MLARPKRPPWFLRWLHISTSRPVDDRVGAHQIGGIATRKHRLVGCVEFRAVGADEAYALFLAADGNELVHPSPIGLCGQRLGITERVVGVLWSIICGMLNTKPVEEQSTTCKREEGEQPIDSLGWATKRR